ncbi:MAG TPA: TIGR03000 domain-containing protein [Thermoguttaceae bacterium]|nr:TIGR03000 domain-containing protein [Thermoguttaceae bacterium]
MGFTKRTLILGLLASGIALGYLHLPKAEAFWRYWGLGGAPVWTCGYGGCSDGWYLGIRRGPIRRLLLGPYRWYYAGRTCYYSPCVTTCSVCWCDPCCCWDACSPAPVVSSSVPVQVEGGTATQEAPAMPKPVLPSPKPAEPEVPSKTLPGPETPSPTPAPQPPLPGPAQGGLEPTRSDSGLLTIYVPYDAKVFINGLETRTPGSRRQYVSYGLMPGYRYKYEVRVEIVRDGKILEDTKVVYLTPGAKEALAFGFNVPSAEGIAAAP